MCGNAERVNAGDEHRVPGGPERHRLPERRIDAADRAMLDAVSAHDALRGFDVCSRIPRGEMGPAEGRPGEQAPDGEADCGEDPLAPRAAARTRRWRRVPVDRLGHITTPARDSVFREGATGPSSGSAIRATR